MNTTKNERFWTAYDIVSYEHECAHSMTLRRVSVKLLETEEENRRLREFNLKLADRIFAAHEVLGRLAERKTKNG